MTDMISLMDYTRLLDSGAFINFMIENIYNKVEKIIPCNLFLTTRRAREASSYRPSKNGFSKQQNTRGTGQADNIDMFYHREWPEQIGCTKSRVSMALG